MTDNIQPTVVEQPKQTRECPYCQQVFDKGQKFYNHRTKCKLRAEKAAVVSPPDTSAADALKSSLSEITDPEMRKVMETAIATQEAMRRTPRSFIADLTSDENMTLIKTYAPEAVESFGVDGRPLNKQHAYFADARSIQVDVARGYMPVVKNGQYIRNRGGDILCTLDRKMYDARISAVENESRGRISRVTDSAISANPDLKKGDIKEESFGNVGELTLTSDDRDTG